MNSKEKIINYIYSLHLQNNTERTDFDRAFKYGIECAIEELVEMNVELSHVGIQGRNDE